MSMFIIITSHHKKKVCKKEANMDIWMHRMTAKPTSKGNRNNNFRILDFGISNRSESFEELELISWNRTIFGTPNDRQSKITTKSQPVVEKRETRFQTAQKNHSKSRLALEVDKESLPKRSKHVHLDAIVGSQQDHKKYKELI